jgi:hypothetical protein
MVVLAPVGRVELLRLELVSSFVMFPLGSVTLVRRPGETYS